MNPIEAAEKILSFISRDDMAGAVLMPAFYRGEPPAFFFTSTKAFVVYRQIDEEDIPGWNDLGFRRLGRFNCTVSYLFSEKAYELSLGSALVLSKEHGGYEDIKDFAHKMELIKGIFDVVPLKRLEMKADSEAREKPALKVSFQRLSDNCILPSYAHEGDAGMDVSSSEEAVIEPGKTAVIGTGFKMALPSGYAAFIQPRSGLAAKSGITVLNTPGLIDCHYRGEVKIILINLGERAFRVNTGDRIAQMVIQRVERAESVEVRELDDTQRGEGGFGSTGV